MSCTAALPPPPACTAPLGTVLTSATGSAPLSRTLVDCATVALCHSPPLRFVPLGEPTWREPADDPREPERVPSSVSVSAGFGGSEMRADGWAGAGAGGGVAAAGGCPEAGGAVVAGAGAGAGGDAGTGAGAGACCWSGG